MTEEDYKAVISAYQQKAFELFNQNIVFETQINTMKKTIELLNHQIETLKNKKTTKSSTADFQ